MNKHSKMLYYFASIVLLTIYLLVLFTTTVPKVPYEYQLYYISKSLQDWPGYNGLEYTLGDIILLTTEGSNLNIAKRRGFNWNAIEEDGCWTFGDRASLFFTSIEPEHNQDSIYGHFDISDIRDNCSAKVFANNTYLGEINEEGVFIFEIPNNSYKDENGKIEIKFLLENYGSIEEDSRNQGIKLRRVLLSEDKISFN